MQPRVRILTTGGTIASTGGDDASEGKTPSKAGDDLLETIPEIDEFATIEVEDVCQVSGFQLTLEHAADLLEAVDCAADDGVDGVVVTHGTDTMAESAFLAELARDLPLPVVFTGAQRSFDQPGTDGPTNLTLAVRTAAHERFRDDGGSYLAFNDTVHAARWVVKGHTSRLETFQSPETGPIAELTTNGLRFLREPGRYAPRIEGAAVGAGVRVEIVTNAAGVDGRQVESGLEAGVDGFVLAGTGLGNATAELGGALESALDSGVPVVLTSRCHAGTTAGVYGGGGGAQTLLEAGAIGGGDLPAWKARLLLVCALSAGRGLEGVREAFDAIDSVA
ncbi:asparaginase [Natrononativus amylolyticus]|uniref:asparaginase n=1 Tax=Natrononativus amylolyticus TaxID=2963434 RepID=UPI0020CF5106|nr:asparaginase [Natrononativus amylolyticus]